MTANEANDPVAITAFGANAIMLQPHKIAHLIEQFFGLRGSGGAFRLGNMSRGIKGGSPLDKRMIHFICLKLQILGAESSLDAEAHAHCVGFTGLCTTLHGCRSHCLRQYHRHLAGSDPFL